MEEAASRCVLHCNADVLAGQEDLLCSSSLMGPHHDDLKMINGPAMQRERQENVFRASHLELDDMRVSQLGVVEDLSLDILVHGTLLEQLTVIREQISRIEQSKASYKKLTFTAVFLPWRFFASSTKPKLPAPRFWTFVYLPSVSRNGSPARASCIARDEARSMVASHTTLHGCGLATTEYENLES